MKWLLCSDLLCFFLHENGAKIDIAPAFAVFLLVKWSPLSFNRFLLDFRGRLGLLLSLSMFVYTILSLFSGSNCCTLGVVEDILCEPARDMDGLSGHWSSGSGSYRHGFCSLFLGLPLLFLLVGLAHLLPFLDESFLFLKILHGDHSWSELGLLILFDDFDCWSTFGLLTLAFEAVRCLALYVVVWFARCRHLFFSFVSNVYSDMQSLLPFKAFLANRIKSSSEKFWTRGSRGS